VENAIEEEFGKRLTLWSVDEDEAFEYLDVDPGATTGALDLSNNVSVIWHLARIAWMKKAIDRTKAAFHRQTATEDIDSDKTEGDELKQGSETRYRFDAASVMAWPVPLPAARIASAISRAGKILTAALSVALVCLRNCFVCVRGVGSQLA
jgi:hypothetical protein